MSALSGQFLEVSRPSQNSRLPGLTEYSTIDEGQPQCYNSQTCLFTTVGDFYIEGCGQTSIAYDWITREYPTAKYSDPSSLNKISECWNYPQTQTGTAGYGETFWYAYQVSCEASFFLS